MRRSRRHRGKLGDWAVYDQITGARTYASKVRQLAPETGFGGLWTEHTEQFKIVYGFVPYDIPVEEPISFTAINHQNSDNSRNPWDSELIDPMNGVLTIYNGGDVVPLLFRAYRTTAQTITDNTITKVQFNAESYDTSNSFDSITNYRFTPTLAGKYYINSQVIWDTPVSATPAYEMYIYKNGSSVTQVVSDNTASLSGYYTQSIQDVIDMNGSTDYIEIYAYQLTGGSITIGTGFNGSSHIFVYGAKVS